jgi:L-threonylcarbamoyladenylate synthase
LLERIEVVLALDAAGIVSAARRASEALAAGGLVVHRTETVYGIGGDGSAENNGLISRIKRRDPDQPLLLLLPDLDTLRRDFPLAEWPEEADRIAQWCWPGPLTLVVKCEGTPQGLKGPGGGLALRISPDPTVSAILERWKRPMTSTSANLQGQEPARTLEQALEVFAGREDLENVEVPVVALEAGPSKGRTPSTVLSFVEKPPRILREGPVGREQLAAWLPNLK